MTSWNLRQPDNTVKSGKNMTRQWIHSENVSTNAAVPSTTRDGPPIFNYCWEIENASLFLRKTDDELFL